MDNPLFRAFKEKPGKWWSITGCAVLAITAIILIIIYWAVIRDWVISLFKKDDAAANSQAQNAQNDPPSQQEGIPNNPPNNQPNNPSNPEAGKIPNEFVSLPEYEFVQGIDYPGNNIVQVPASLGPEKIRINCDTNASCVGYNTDGYLKHKLGTPINWSADATKGFYIRKN